MGACGTAAPRPRLPEAAAGADERAHTVTTLLDRPATSELARPPTGRRPDHRVRSFVADWLLPSREMPREPWAVVLGALYVAAVAALGGLRVDHVFLGALGLLDLYNERTRRFLRTFLPFILTGAIYDSMRYWLWPAIADRVHVAAPYLHDRAWFGVGGRTLNEVFARHHWPALDLLTGLAYLTYVAEYLALAVLLFLQGRAAAARSFARCFLVVNLLGFVTYLAYPAAPPWYVAAHGLGPVAGPIAPAPAATVRFDALLGTDVFARLYGRGVVVFGAYPSLHVAYPLLAALLALRLPALRWARAPAALFFLLVCLSAVYLQHHYVTDVVLGIGYALATFAAVTAWERRRPPEG